MTKEELEKEARINLKRRFGEYFPQLTISYVMGAEQREKQIQIDAEQIRALQKQNGELTNKVAELEKEVKYYQAREQERGWLRTNELSHEEFCELMDFLNVAYEENTEVYKEACESVSNVWDRIAVARCGVWEMMFERMYIQAYRKGKDSEVEK